MICAMSDKLQFVAYFSKKPAIRELIDKLKFVGHPQENRR